MFISIINAIINKHNELNNNKNKGGLKDITEKRNLFQFSFFIPSNSNFEA